MKKIYGLRIIHGLFAIYFITCVLYLYYAALWNQIDYWLLLAIGSLGAEGLAVFVLNHGDCPLIYLQRRIGDEVPFFNLVLPDTLAKQAIPFFSILTWIGLGLVGLRLLFNYLV